MRHVLGPLRHASLAAFLILAQSLCLAAFAQNPLEKWHDFNFSKQIIRPEQLKGLDEYDLKLLRGLVFGRHGRIFKDTDIKSYLKEISWYTPNPDFSNSMLNDTERRNLDTIRMAEAKVHTRVEPGDMRYYQNRPLTAKQLGEHTGAEWRILRAEVEAIHGKRFDDQPWLQQYFEERYWYKADPNYDPKRLSTIERRNIATIDAAQKKQRNVAISPGDMEYYRSTPITEAMLQGLGLYELRLLRNEVYARRGRQFQIPWISNYFYGQIWYEPSETFKDEEVTGIEKQNVETIVNYENKLKNELSAKPISPKLLDGLFLEDARKLRYEIYARHGMVFKEKWFQQYFASFDWYKPDPKFKETSLTGVEKRNVAAILAYERKATSVLDAIEG